MLHEKVPVPPILKQILLVQCRRKGSIAWFEKRFGESALTKYPIISIIDMLLLNVGDFDQMELYCRVEVDNRTRKSLKST